MPPGDNAEHVSYVLMQAMKCLCTVVLLCKLDTRLVLEQFLLKGSLGKSETSGLSVNSQIERQRESSGLSEVFNKLLRRKTRFLLNSLQGMETISYDLPNQLFKCPKGACDKGNQ